MSFRIAGDHDVDILTHVINEAFGRAESFFLERDRIDPGKVRQLMLAGEFLMLQGTSGTAGCVYIERKDERAYVGLLAVEPGRQSVGLGSRIMSEAEQRCRKAGCRFVDIRIVSLRSELPRFYRKRGYLETGTAPFTPGVETKIPCHFIMMTKRLEQDDNVKKQ